MDTRKKGFLPSLALALLIAGCGKEEPKQVMRGSQAPTVAVESVVAVRSGGVQGQLLIPASALFRNGALAGVLVVGADQRLTQRWIRIGRSAKGNVVVLGGLDKGELVVGKYNPELVEGVTVIKSPRAAEEVQKK